MNEEPIMMVTDSNNPSPQSVVDSASLTNSMNKNKESLKLKLMLRRPIDVLVDQGILPPPKSSPTFYEQKLKLERAKTGDYLKHKIQRRPQRDELVQQHILEDNFDPSYYEQERKLKRARLADDLNERLSHRPGPLELIKGNILHTDETLEQAIKDGQITFKKTCEGEIIKNPPKRFVFEEESSSDSAPSPSLQNSNQIQCNLSTHNQNFNSASASISQLSPQSSFIVSKQANLVPLQPEPTTNNQQIVPNTVLNAANLSYILTSTVNKDVLQPPTATQHTNAPTVYITTNNNQNQNQNNFLPPPSSNTNNNNTNSLIYNKSTIDHHHHSSSFNFGPTINKSILNVAQSVSQKSKTKKIKSKTAPKTRIIKFHEYKGPPNARKQSNSNQQSTETSYELLLKQQQLFLQWQLESCGKFTQQQAANNHVNHQQQQINPNQQAMRINSIVDLNPQQISILEQQSVITNEMNNSHNPIKALPNDARNKKQMIGNHEQQESPNQSNFEGFDNISKKMNKPEPTINPSIVNQKGSIPNVKKIISKLEDMKVSDLKAELKKRNLPVSGAKQQLIERLKPFSETVVIQNNAFVAAEMNGNIFNDNHGFQHCSTNQQQPHFIYQDINNLGSLTSNPTTTAIILNNSGMNNGGVQENGFPTMSTVQLKQTNQHPITLDGSTTTLAIPLGNTTFTLPPQYQVLASQPPTSVSNHHHNDQIQVNGLNINTTTKNGATTATLPNNILVPQAGASQTINYTPTTINSLDSNGSNNLTIFTSPRIQLAQLDGSPLNFGTAIIQPAATHMNNKLVGLQNSGPVITQLLLYPNTTVNTNQSQHGEMNNNHHQGMVTKQNRSNSIPAEAIHPLQRNTSLPLIINQMPISQIPIDANNFKLIKVADSLTLAPEQLNGNKDNSCSSSNTIKNPSSSRKTTKNSVKNSNITNKNNIVNPEINLKKIVEENNNTGGFQAYSMEKSKTESANQSNHLLNDVAAGKMIPIVTTTVATNDDNVDGFKNSYVDSSTIISSSNTNNGNNHIQPDSTTNNNNNNNSDNLDFDFMLNFDELNAFEEQINHSSSATSMLSTSNHKNNQEKEKAEIHNNDMIDFNDNWLDFTFSDNNQNFMQTVDHVNTNNHYNFDNNDGKPMMMMDSKRNVQNNSNANCNNVMNHQINTSHGDDHSLFETVDRIFDDLNPDRNNQCQQPESLITNEQPQSNQFNRFMNNNFDIEINSNNNRINFDCVNNNNYQNNNNSAQQFDYANSNGYISNDLNHQNSTNNNNNNLNGLFNNHHHPMSSNTSNAFNDLYFEESDFKNSMDFPLLFDTPIDFAT